MEQQSTQPTKRRRPLVIAGVAVGVVVVLCLCVVILSALAPSNDSQTADAPVTAQQQVEQNQEPAANAPAATSDAAEPIDTPEPTSVPASTNTPAPTNTPEPTPTPVPTDTPEPLEAGTSRSNPLPLGSEILMDTWSIGISSTIRGQEATEAIANANQFNDLPRDGYEYLIANMTMKNVSDSQEAESVDFAVSLHVTGDKNVRYSRASVIPPKRLEGEVFPDGIAEGQIVFEVPSDEQNLMFIVDEFISLDSNTRRFVAADQDASIVPDRTLREIEPTELGSQRNNPAKVGDVLVTGPWEFQVIEAVRGDQAAELAVKANMFNDAPPEGEEYVAVRLKARYLGSSDPDHSENINGSFLKIAGENNIVYESPSVVPPEPRFDSTLFAGGEVEGWEILSVSEGEQSLVLIFEPLFSFARDDTRYVSIE